MAFTRTHGVLIILFRKGAKKYAKRALIAGAKSHRLLTAKTFYQARLAGKNLDTLFKKTINNFGIKCPNLKIHFAADCQSFAYTPKINLHFAADR